MSFREVLGRAGTIIGRSIGDGQGGYSAGKIMSGLGQAYFYTAGYNAYKDEGKSTLGAIANTAVDNMFIPLLGWTPYIGYELLKAGGGFVGHAVEVGAQARSFNQNIRNEAPFRSQTVVDGQQIYTMRQAGMALAQQAKYKQVAAMMGNEAQYMHR